MSFATFTVMSKRADLLTLVRTVPTGRVTTFDILAKKLGEPPALVQSRLAHLTEDERDLVPWHRVVAKGGAIGRGPHRDQQFARLVREGVQVLPAGIVHDMPRFLVTLDALPECRKQPETPPQISQPLSRSRGMKSRP
ncbi:methylated-DNA-(protein)-cysteine S-methyltransferase DNA binding protein [Hyphomicrobium denitrificans 1NES1]|uniref:Methylated-DNA-(Protein)-cysteine S-methyltransferase DNA binding protein n=2 Tax=Hyphomicrobium denitrificans TaxID=53399 RepID=N0BD28_9HYPH|nr:methylated-DNA-(protein)-cysteine S-methyltransferase DNA binding protein [Hyphomicrobium denitrificans 1NES1]